MRCLLIVLSALVVATATDAQDSKRPTWESRAAPQARDHVETARDVTGTAAFIDTGRQLFATKFNVLDGAGRPEATGDSKPTARAFVGPSLFNRIAGPDGNSCKGCHHQPVAGGAGEISANVFVGAHFSDPITESVAPEVTNERNTTSILGAGAIELLAREITRDLRSQRQRAVHRARTTRQHVAVDLASKEISFGRLLVRPDGSVDISQIEGVDPDLILKPFGVKGVAVSLREFTIFALNQHHGIQAVERFGWARTGMRDFDGDGIEVELDISQLSALSLYQATLSPPPRPPEGEGLEIFVSIGCGDCHRPVLYLDSAVFTEPNPLNRPGAAVPQDLGDSIRVVLPHDDGLAVYRDGDRIAVAAFTDLKRHVICDEQDMFYCDERVPQDFVPTRAFLTPRLWDVGSTAPYGHRGNLSTISEAILHHAGEARPSLERFMELPDSGKRLLVEYLKSLEGPTGEETRTAEPSIPTRTGES